MTKILAALTAAVLLSATAAQAAEDDLKAFPPPKPGMVRHVLRLPMQPDESNFKVELIVGKSVKLDAANRYFFGGKIEEETVQGWGYTFFKVDAVGPMAGTLIGVDPNVPKVDRFITLGGEPHLVRYNSKLPLVVYVPQGYEARYRVWSAPAEMKSIGKE